MAVPAGVRGARLVRALADRADPRAGAGARQPELPTRRTSSRPERRLFERSLPPAPDKPLYADIAAAPRLSRLDGRVVRRWSGRPSVRALGWTGALLYLVPLVPIGVALMIIDWRTTLLPTRIIHPTYALLAVLIPRRRPGRPDLDSLYRAGWGWLVIGGWFWVFWWLLTRGGSATCAWPACSGPALGYLGWYELLMGLALIVIVGGVGGLVIGIVTGDLRRRVPYGPFMLVGSALAVVVGPWLARSLGY